MNTFADNLMYYLTPSEYYELSPEERIRRQARLGGLVVENSVQRNSGEIKFILTDFCSEMEVRFRGVTPELFKEGSSAVCEGSLTSEGYFRATKVLAKHDENYIPKEFEEKLSVNKEIRDMKLKAAERQGKLAAIKSN
eukprot:Sdes_comp19541_c0_seq2m11156